MFKKILFATTASPACDNAAKVAFDLEMKWEAELSIFHVLGVPARGYSSFVTDVRTGLILSLFTASHSACSLKLTTDVNNESNSTMSSPHWCCAGIIEPASIRSSHVAVNVVPENDPCTYPGVLPPVPMLNGLSTVEPSERFHVPFTLAFASTWVHSVASPRGLSPT